MPGYRRIVVHVDRSDRSAARVRVALGIAARTGAALTGLYALSGPLGSQSASLAGGADPPGAAAHDRFAAEAMNAAEGAFRDDVARVSGVDARWEVATSDALESLRTAARFSDLLVIGQQTRGDEAESGISSDFEHELVLGAGRPVLIIPKAGHHTSAGRRVLVAWKEARESARAVTDALPVLATAETVEVVTVAPRTPREAAGIEASEKDLVAYLASHGVRAVSARTLAGGQDVGEQILERAAAVDADLIVMGAYGHSRLREWVLGGVTRTVLARMTVPVLMSH